MVAIPRKLTAPCAAPGCPAMVEKAGQRCSVHRVWTDGPHTHPCVQCRRPIVGGELWRLIDGDATRPAHAACLNHRRYDRKAAATQGGLF